MQTIGRLRYAVLLGLSGLASAPLACGDESGGSVDEEARATDAAADGQTGDVKGGDAALDGSSPLDAGGEDGAADASRFDAGDTDAAVPPDAGGADAGADASVCPLGAVCSGDYNYAFVTSAPRVLTTLGIAGADAHCTALAAAAGLPGSYVAWMSSSTSTARARLGSASGWLRPDRRIFAVDATSLYDGRLHYPPMLDERGVVRDLDVALTGTQGDGTVADPNCGDWTSTLATDRAMGGYPWMTSLRWSVSALGQCNQASPLYCLGKDRTTPIPWTPVVGRRAFVTAASFVPSGGLAGADALCASEATAAGLAGTFKALLATKTASAMSRFSTAGPTWVRVDGVPLWDSAADAAASAPILTPILLRANGAATSDRFLWLGAPTLSGLGVQTCDDWASAAGTSTAQTAQIDQAASNFLQSSLACDTATSFNVKLACFEQ